jgi:8-oxo-dGTP diphosphatase
VKTPIPTVADNRSPERPAGGTSSRLDLRIVLFTVIDGTLALALIDDEGRARLPQGAPAPHDSLDRDARRILHAETGLTEQYLEQLYTLGVDETGGWSVIVAYLGLALSERRSPVVAGGGWHVISALPPMSETDRMVIDYALVRLRAKLGYTTIAFHLLPPTFTLRELQQVYESVLGHALDKRNFRRRVLAAGFLEETGARRRDGSHRPAQLYRFEAAHDPDAYLTPTWARGE